MSHVSWRLSSFPVSGYYQRWVESQSLLEKQPLFSTLLRSSTSKKRHCCHLGQISLHYEQTAPEIHLGPITFSQSHLTIIMWCLKPWEEGCNLHFRVPCSDLPEMYLHVTTPSSCSAGTRAVISLGKTRIHQALVKRSQCTSVKFQVRSNSAKCLMPFLESRITKYLRTDSSPNRWEEPISSCFSGKILPALQILHMEAKRC